MIKRDYPLCPVCGGRTKMHTNGAFARTCGLPGCIAEVRTRAMAANRKETLVSPIVADFSGQNIEPGDGGGRLPPRPDRGSYTGCSAAWTVDRG
jgi:hypothetical protein